MDSLSRNLAAKIRLRLVYPTIIFMLLSSLDRVNISFAVLQMKDALGFTPEQYGFGAGILFVGFLAGQYPSIFLLQRIGMRKWLTCCAVVWGLCSASMGVVETHLQFYVIRVIMGLAEGGLAPGIVVYLSRFATERERARTFAMPMLAIPLSIILGGPISGWLMEQSAPFDLASWRWMFFAEAIPTVLLGLVAWFYFPDRPAEAHWLSDEEKTWLARNSANHSHGAAKYDWSALRQPLIWISALIWFCQLSGAYGIMFWLPQMVRQLTGLSPTAIGFVNALPWIGSALGMYFNSAHSDKTGERYWHVGLPAALAALSIVAASLFGAGVPGLAALFLAGLSLGAAQGAFWALPTRLFTPQSFAVGTVAINIAGTSGGIITPQVIGIVREATGGFGAPTMVIAAVVLLGAVLVPLVGAGAAQRAKAAE